jgi:hypothetical protein
VSAFSAQEGGMAWRRTSVALLVFVPALAVAEPSAPSGGDGKPANSAASIPAWLAKPSLWTVVRTSSIQTAPKTERMCLNPVGAKAMFSGPAAPSSPNCHLVRATDPDGGAHTSYACKQPGNGTSMTTTLQVDISADKRLIHQRSDFQSEPPLPPPLDKPMWNEATMTYAGDCPLPMRPDQAVIEIQPDGTALDPVQAVSDMAKNWKDEETQFAAGASSAALAAAPDPASARVVSIQVKRMDACAWVDTGGRDGLMPVRVSGMAETPGKVTFYGSITPIAGRPLHERVNGAFFREEDVDACGDNLPAKPPGALMDPAIYAPLATLWATPEVKWAIIPAMGDPGYLGVMRRRNGGDIQTPVFVSTEAVKAWLAAKGDRLADAVEAEGQDLATRSGACIAKAKGDEWKNCPDWPTSFTVLDQ